MSTTGSDAPIAEAAAAEVAGGNGAALHGGPATPARRPGPQERQVFVACVIAVLVYLVLVYFVFVRPGVDRVDHVLAVVIPAAILALSAELYPRLPAGLRASLMLVFGVIGLVTGGVHVRRLRVEGVSASALCGLLPLAAGAVLVVLGVWLAWTSRKRGGPLWWTVLRRALIAVAALFVVYWIVLPVSLAIVATERPNVPVPAADLGRPHEDVTLVTRDGLELGAWYVPSQNRAAIVTFPRAWSIRAGAHAREARLRRPLGRPARLR